MSPVLSLLHAWVVLPALFLAVLYGLGLLAENIGGRSLPGALIAPLGLAALIAVAAFTTAIAAGATTPILIALAIVGLIRGRTAHALKGWPILAAAGASFAYGAPILLSGHATFAGYFKLDDTATWFSFADQVMSHGRDFGSLAPSTVQLVLDFNVGTGYPLGAYMPLGVAHQLSGVDVAWAFGPYVAICGGLIAATAYALAGPFVDPPRLRALIGCVAAQPALLYGYTQWGGIKEITFAALVVLLVATAATAPSWSVRGAFPFALVTAAAVAVAGPVGAAFAAPIAAVTALRWAGGLPPATALRSALKLGAGLVAMVGLLGITSWLELTGKVNYAGQRNVPDSNVATALGNLTHALSLRQAGGIWFERDFRATAGAFPTDVFLLAVLGAAVSGVALSVKRRRPELVVYLVVVFGAYWASRVTDTTPWVLAKTLAIAGPAVLLTALVGSVTWAARSLGGVALTTLLVAGVLWSNVLSYSATPVAPRERLAELEEIGTLVDGKGPTFDNEYELYATRHFLRRGDPVSPAELRAVNLPTAGGALLTKSAFADIDSFSVTTLFTYRSIVTGRTPTSSRPPSVYDEVFRGRYYSLYQRPAVPEVDVIEHLPLGDSNQLPYCGNAQNAGALAQCPKSPAAVPACADVRRLREVAASRGATLVAYERPAPVVVRADETRWPAAWFHDAGARSLLPLTAGTLTAQIRLTTPGSYELWLGGSFDRGFVVTIDGERIGKVARELANIGSDTPVAQVRLPAGVHTVTLRYPHTGLAPGDADINHYTRLDAIVLQPTAPAGHFIAVPPGRAGELCGRTLDWIEVVGRA